MKWITIQGRDREGKGLFYLIHGAHDLQEGDRVLVFPSTDRRIPYAVAKGLDISPGARVVAVPHSKMPWSRIRTSVFANDSIPPTANFEADPTYGYQPLTVSFTDTSYANPPAEAWHWDFGDGSTSEEQHPSHTYQGLGWFTVTLTVSNGLGSDTIRKEALIFSGVDHPVDLNTVRTGDSTARISWVPGANNTQVVITRRHDFFPPHPNNATRIYHGAAGGGPITDSGLDPSQDYFYRVWGIRDGILSDGYRSDQLSQHQTPPGSHYLASIVRHGVKGCGSASSLSAMLGSPGSSFTYLGNGGWVEAAWAEGIDIRAAKEAVIYENSGAVFKETIRNPGGYLYPNEYTFNQGSEYYSVSFRLPNIIRIEITGFSGSGCPGNIYGVELVVP